MALKRIKKELFNLKKIHQQIVVQGLLTKIYLNGKQLLWVHPTVHSPVVYFF